MHTGPQNNNGDDQEEGVSNGNSIHKEISDWLDI